jgi:hypothetical protein
MLSQKPKIPGVQKAYIVAKAMEFAIPFCDMQKLKKLLKISFFARILYPRYYSQTGEDLIISQMLGKRKGQYIDVGSGYPIWGSNTYSLYLKGWNGILIDPIKRNIRYSRLIRPRDKSILGAIGSKKENAIFYEFTDYVYSTFSEEICQSRIDAGLVLKDKYEVNFILINELFQSLDNSKLILLSIDTEGQEESILKSINFDKFLPEIIIAEEIESPLKKISAIGIFLNKKGYSLYAYTGYSSIYCHRSFSAY